MSTVPRPVGAPEPTEADQLRELLAAIVDVLDTPTGDDIDADMQRTVTRSIFVKHVARAAAGPLPPTDPAQVLRDQVAKYAPVPEGGNGE